MHLMANAGKLVVVLEEALLWLDALAEDGEAPAWRWQVRVQAASTVMAAISTAQQHLPEQLLSMCTQRVCALLRDEVYLGRVEGARMLPALLRTSPRLQVCTAAMLVMAHECTTHMIAGQQLADLKTCSPAGTVPGCQSGAVPRQCPASAGRHHGAVHGN